MSTDERDAPPGGPPAPEREGREATEQALARREAELRVITDAVPALVAYVDAGERYRLCNRAYLEWFGRPPEALLGRTVREVLGDAAYAAIRPHLREVLAGRPVAFETEVPYLDGPPRWVEASYTPHLDPAGRVLGYVGMVRDVSERRRAERERDEMLARVAASEARFRRLYESGVIGILFWTREGRITDANDAFLQMVGYRRDDLEGGRIAWREMTPPEFAPLDERAFAEMERRGLCTPYEKEYLHKEGRRVPVMLGIAFREGSTREGVAWVLDISARKRDEERRNLLVDAGRALSSSTDYREALAAVARLLARRFATLALVDLVDDEGRLGPNAVLAHRDPALEGPRRERWRASPPGPDHPAAQAALSGASRRVAGGGGALAPAAPDPAVRSSAAVPLVSRGRALGVLWLDSSEREYDDDDLATVEELGRRAGSAVDAARLFEIARAESARAEEANRAKDEFLAVVSHELRTPLNAILGWARMLQSGALDAARQGHAVATIERNARAQAQIVDDLLDVSRIVTGKLRLDVGPVDLARAVEAAADSVRPAAEAKGVRLELALDPAAGPVMGDADRLQQIAWNLLSNALRHTPRGGRVEVCLARREAQLELRVEDTGEGVAPEFLPHLFERFRQADSSTTRRHGGLGLGLAIVKHLVELHGGAVRAESEGPGRGSTFVVSLPVPPPRPAPPPEPPPALGARAPGADDAPAELAGLRVLVVDDEEDARELVRTLLEQEGVEVETAPSAERALELLRARRFDALISDIGMPGTDGHAFLRRLRALPASQGGQTPAVALTAYARLEDRTRALLAGFQIHLPKPVDPAELLAVLATVTGRLAP
ncbi:MAG TPA: PAS domain-containing protein [Polyangiaceae bacterium]|nr:PAS domain-containing protein [Polyangiaceae bacterium]